MKIRFLSSALFTLALAACGGKAEPVKTAGDDAAAAVTAEPTAAPVDTAKPADTAVPAPTATASAAPATPMAMVAAADAAIGKGLYEEQKCNTCHGTSDKAPKKFPNLFKITWDEKHVNEAFEIIKKGKAPMPSYTGKLDDKQIAAIVAFVKANPAK